MPEPQTKNPQPEISPCQWSDMGIKSIGYLVYWIASDILVSDLLDCIHARMRGLTRMLHRHEGRVLQHVSHAHTHPRFTCTHASTFHMHTRVLHHVSPHRAAACFTCTHASTAQTLHTNAKGPRHSCVHHQCTPRSVFLAAGLEIKHTRVPGPGVGPESNVQANIRPRVQHTTPLGFRVSKWGFT